jgi:hypothetical protein
MSPKFLKGKHLVRERYKKKLQLEGNRQNDITELSTTSNYLFMRNTGLDESSDITSCWVLWVVCRSKFGKAPAEPGKAARYK